MAMDQRPIPEDKPAPPDIGVSKRQKMADDMKRRGMLRQIQDMSQRFPGALNGVARARTSKGGGGLSRMGRAGAPVDSALRERIAPRRSRGGGGGSNGAVTGVYPGSPAYYGSNWGVSPEERLAGDTYAGGAELYRGPEMSDAQAQEMIRERLIGQLDLSAQEEQARLRRDAAMYGKAPGPASIAAQPNTGKIADLELKAQMADDGTEEGSAKAAQFRKGIDFLKSQMPQTATPTAAPMADIANRSSWEADPGMVPAMLTNRPDVLTQARGVTDKVGPALAQRFGSETVGPTSPVNLSGDLGPAPAPVTPVVRTLKDGTKVKVVQDSAGKWVEV